MKTVKEWKLVQKRGSGRPKAFDNIYELFYELIKYGESSRFLDSTIYFHGLLLLIIDSDVIELLENDKFKFQLLPALEQASEQILDFFDGKEYPKFELGFSSDRTLYGIYTYNMLKKISQCWRRNSPQTIMDAMPDPSWYHECFKYYKF